MGFSARRRDSHQTERNRYTRFSLATSINWKENGNSDYKTRTEWHRVICWNKLADWAGNLHEGEYVEVEGELRYREYTPTESDRNVRVAQIYATSILALERSVAQNGSASADSDPGDEPAD